MSWETVIGLEVHAELSTKTKIFCGCANAFGGEPNTHVCPVCAGMPGTLPVLNRAVVLYAVRLGLALDCRISPLSRFDRKNYFYPDLPKAYQISQLYAPICSDGRMEIEAGGVKKDIGIREIHMEEDAGKLIHEGGESHMDFNRCGVPLLEIVTRPDFRGADEVLAYLEKLREILTYLDICDGKMQEGSLRVDVNLSLRPSMSGGENADRPYGTRTEMKNLNSFRSVRRAIEAERLRHIRILEKGGQVAQETRRWDDERGESQPLRSKENAHDYRYFPEPDLLPIVIDDPLLEEARAGLPELAHEKRDRYGRDFGLAAAEAIILTGHKGIAALFEAVAARSGEPLESARLVTGEIMRLLHENAVLPEDLALDAGKLACLVTYVTEGKINRGAYKEAVEAVFLHDVDPVAYVAEKGLMMMTDSEAVAEAVRAVLAENAEAMADYRAGKAKAFGFLVGQTMKALGATADPRLVRTALEEAVTSPLLR